MKILFAATPLTGHVNPLLALALLLASRGDEVLFVTGAAFEAKVKAAGLRFVPLVAEGAPGYRATDLPAGAERSRREFERRFIDAMPGQAARLRDLFRDERPAVVVAGSMVLGILPLLLGSGPRPRIVVYNVSFLFHDRADGAPLGFGLLPATNAAQAAHYAAFRAGVDAAFTDPVRLYTDALLAEEGLPGLPASLTQSIVTLPDAFIQATVPDFEYDYGPLPPNLRFVGTLPPPKVEAILPDWWCERDPARRVVLVTQGTLANHDFCELVVPTLTGLAHRDDLFVVATTGGRPVEALGIALPDNARVASFLPFADMLPEVDLLVTNGGYGSVSMALQAGVPLVSAGLTEDKGEIGARIGWSGVGVNLATNAPTADQVKRAVDTVLGDARFAERAASVARSFARHDAPREILALIDEVACARHPVCDPSHGGSGSDVL